MVIGLLDPEAVALVTVSTTMYEVAGDAPEIKPGVNATETCVESVTDAVAPVGVLGAVNGVTAFV